MVDKFEKARRSQKLKDMGIRKVGLSRYERPKGQLKGPDYLVAHACFSCRKSFKRLHLKDEIAICPQCAGPLARMGRAFIAPRKNNLKQWKKTQLLWEAGYRFPSNTYDSADYPKRLQDVEEFIEANPKHPCRLREYWPTVKNDVS